MSKRYIIQANVSTDPANPTWENLEHPAGGTWMTRSRTTARRDAARLVLNSDGNLTAEKIQVVESRPVYETVLSVGPAEIQEAVEFLQFTAGTVLDPETVLDDDDDDDSTAVLKAPTTEQVEDSHEPEDEGTCCFKHRQDWLQSQM
jgi:hypothetical protein